MKNIKDKPEYEIYKSTVNAVEVKTGHMLNVSISALVDGGKYCAYFVGNLS